MVQSALAGQGPPSAPGPLLTPPGAPPESNPVIDAIKGADFPKGVSPINLVKQTGNKYQLHFADPTIKPLTVSTDQLAAMRLGGLHADTGFMDNAGNLGSLKAMWNAGTLPMDLHAQIEDRNKPIAADSTPQMIAPPTGMMGPPDQGPPDAGGPPPGAPPDQSMPPSGPPPSGPAQMQPPGLGG